MILMLSELKPKITFRPLSILFKYVWHPFLSTFLLIVYNGINYFHGGKTFNIFYYHTRIGIIDE